MTRCLEEKGFFPSISHAIRRGAWTKKKPKQPNKVKIEKNIVKKDDLLNLASENGISIPKNATIPTIRETILSFSPAPETETTLSDEDKDAALGNAKKAKKHAKNKSGRAAMAAVYDSFRTLLPEGEKELKLSTVTVEFWKARPDAADFAGCTIRRKTGGKPSGYENALLDTIYKVFKGCGFPEITPVIRKGGSGAVHF